MISILIVGFIINIIAFFVIGLFIKHIEIFELVLRGLKKGNRFKH
jgi:hypothetical protein